mgnify:FL=1
MKKNVLITYGKNRTVNSATIFFTKNNLELLKITSETKEVIIEYKNDILTIYPFKEGIIDEKYTKGETIIYLKSYIKLEYNKQRSKFQFQIPYEIIKNWNLGENKHVDLKLEKDRLVFKRYKEQKPRYEYRPEYIRNTIPIINIKSITGGVGKTFFASSIGTGLAVAGYKVLILTTDPNNNLLDMLLPVEETKDEMKYYSFDDKEIQIDSKTKGLKYWIKNGTGEIINLRENVDFIPFENLFEDKKIFEQNIGKFLYSLKGKYDYIVIDSNSAQGIDEIILNYTKKLVIPCSCDRFSFKGLIQAIQELGVDRIAVIAFNRYLNSIVEKEYYQKIKEKLKGKGIFLNIPVRELAAIKKLIHQNKTIWESTDQRLAEVQIVFKEILKRLVYQCSV